MISNSSLGASFALLKIFRISQTPSLASILKIFKNTKLPPQILELFMGKLSSLRGARSEASATKQSTGFANEVKQPSTFFRHSERSALARSEESKSHESKTQKESMTQKRINKPAVIKILFCYFFALTLHLLHANEFTPNKNHAINIVSENDAYFEPFIRSDEYYTAGHFVSYLSPEFADSWINKIAGFAHLYDKHFTRFFVSINQQIYTPENKYIYDDGTTPLKNDILFGAGLYANLSFVSRTRDFMEQFSLDIGVVGPLALGKEVQNGLHKITNKDIARGWDYFGLKNEALINLHYGLIWRWVFIEDFFDVLPHFQISLGNAYTAANAGARFRVGYGIRNDFGFQKLKSRFAQNIADDGLKIYAVFGINGSVVGRDMFIQGNSFGGAKSGVKLNHFLYEIEFGAMIGWKYLSFGYIYTAESKRFKEQKWQHEYGSIRLEIMF